MEQSVETDEFPNLVVLVGNPRPGSRTAAVAVELGRSAAALVRAEVSQVLDLAELTEQLGPPLGFDAAARWAAPLAALHAADLVIVATPTYKGSYTGLLKSFLDQVGGGALHGILGVPVTTVGSPAHTLAADLHLRPLLIELGLSTPTSALVIGNDLLDDPVAAVQPWLKLNTDLLRKLLTAQAFPPADAPSGRTLSGETA